MEKVNLNEMKKDAENKLKKIKDKIQLIELGTQLKSVLNGKTMDKEAQKIFKYITKLSDFRLKQSQEEEQFFTEFIAEIEQELTKAKA